VVRWKKNVLECNNNSVTPGMRWEKKCQTSLQNNRVTYLSLYMNMK